MHIEREFNDVRMICQVYLALLTHGHAGQTYNVCTGQAFSLQNIIATLTQLTGHQLDVRVNPAFVRANEIIRLCGNSAQLLSCTGPLSTFALSDTLQWMLEKG
jgi:nucleoside-diphosphate-sugar epimerase